MSERAGATGLGQLRGIGGGGTPYLRMQILSAARYTGEFSIECGITIAPLLFGSGKFVEPLARMHRQNLSASVIICGDCWAAE